MTWRFQALAGILPFEASLGSTLPMNVGDAFAVSLAEVVGSAILLTEVVSVPLHWGFGF